jgi:hypothetical protein
MGIEISKRHMRIARKLVREGDRNMADPKDEPAAFDQFKILGGQLNIAREVQEIFAEWGGEAATIASQNAAYYRMIGNADKVGEWLEVMRLIEEGYTVRMVDRGTVALI